MINKLVDVGEVESVTCICDHSANCGMFEIKASRGRFITAAGFKLIGQRVPVADILLNDGETVASVFDERICALTYCLAANPYQQTIELALKPGDKLPIRSSEESWEIIRSVCEYNLIDVIFCLMRMPRCWVDCDGNECDEPEWFMRKLILLVTLSALHYYELPQHAGHGNRQYETVLNHIGECIDSLKLMPNSAINDHDFMMDWYEVTATAARTINNHINTWKDCKPNKDKVGKFLDFCSANCQRMENMCARYEYARHLWQRKEQIYNSKVNGWKYAVEKVEVYRRGRFGVM